MFLAERPARLDRFDRFDARAATLALRVFGLALVVDVVTEMLTGVWQVHGGTLYPWRHLGIVPLYPPSVLAIEWLLRAGAGLTLLLFATRAKLVARAVRVAAPVLFVAVLERYSNHGVLLFLIAFFLTIAPPDGAAPSFAAAAHPALGLVRAELVIVYVFSALNKLTHGFHRGESILAMLGSAHASLAPWAPALAWAVIVVELALPVLLVLRPRVGLVAIVVTHVAFAALLPTVTSFGLAMVAMAILFTKAPEPSSDGSSS